MFFNIKGLYFVGVDIEYVVNKLNFDSNKKKLLFILKLKVNEIFL